MKRFLFEYCWIRVVENILKYVIILVVHSKSALYTLLSQGLNRNCRGGIHN